MSDVTFADLGLRPQILEAITKLGFTTPTPIQREAIPVLLKGGDIIGQAATGTGKTAAFGLPILERLVDGHKGKDPIALVLVPTRELAIQVSEAIESFGKDMGARVLAVYGGQPIYKQLAPLNKGVDIIVATPGRAVDHIKRGSMNLDSIELVALDEADEMLDMGFAEELDSILSATPSERQTVFFSATMPSRLRSIANRHLRNPEHIAIAREKAVEGEAPRVRQVVYNVSRYNKPAAMGRILDVEAPAAAIVFCKSRAQVDELTETMSARGYRAEALHGGMDQEQRDRVMNRLRNRTAELLLATDVAARGLDIDHLTHVINYDVPTQVEPYVHRVGRVGRAGREGVAITLAEPKDMRQIKNIERVTKTTIEMGVLPTVADLRKRRLQITQDKLREAITAGEFDLYGDMAEALINEFDVHKLALAAIKMIHEASGATADEREIPEARPERDRGNYDRNDRGGKFERGGSSDRGGKFERGASAGAKRPSRGLDVPSAKLFVGAGRSAGVRPQDLVGAIANESGLSGRQIGSIEILDKFSLVEIPASSVNEVITALKGTTIKGQKVNVRPDKGRQ